MRSGAAAPPGVFTRRSPFCASKNALAQRSPHSIALRFSKRSEALPVSPAANPSPPLSVRQINKTHCAPSTPAKSAAFTAAAAARFQITRRSKQQGSTWRKRNKKKNKKQGNKKSWARRKGMCWGSSYCSHGEALAMLFIHCE